MATAASTLAGDLPLFKKAARVIVAPGDASSGTIGAIQAASGLDISNLDLEFRVRKNLKPEPNTCELVVYNLSSSTRRYLEQPKKLNLSLSAGYGTELAQLFLGQVRRAYSYKSGSNFVTEITTGDSEKEIQSARITQSIGPKVPAAVALTAIAKSLGVGLGNVQAASAKLSATGVTPFGNGGTVLHGFAADILTDFCKSADLEWSIQDGVIQILDVGKSLQNQAVLLDSDSGLIEYPKVDASGIVTATALIQPNLRPGNKVDFESVTVKGGYRIEQCEYAGSTFQDTWQVTFQARKY